MNMKFCKRCQQEKPIIGFYHNKCRADGLQDYCKACSKKLGQGRDKAYLEKYLVRYRTTGKFKGRELRRKARQRGNKFNMTIEEFASWFNKQKKVCHYCGREVFQYRDLPPNQQRLLGLTIDRKDNGKQYTIDNIAIACGRCNLMKGSWLTEEQMLDASRRYFK